LCIPPYAGSANVYQYSFVDSRGGEHTNKKTGNGLFVYGMNVLFLSERQKKNQKERVCANVPPQTPAVAHATPSVQ